MANRSVSEAGSYEIIPVGDDHPCGYAHGDLSLGAVITYAEENFDVDTIIVYTSPNERYIAATVKVR